MTIPTFPLTAINWAYPATRGPVWKTTKNEAWSGKETRMPQWTFPRWKWTIPFSVLRQNSTVTEFATLVAFINGLAGGGLPFYFTDPYDNAVTNQQFGVGDGTTTAFQLVRSFGGFVEPVQSPNGTPVIKINGSPTTAFTLGSAGVVTFTSAPAAAAVLTWTGSYYWLCRLDDDSAQFNELMSGFLELQKLAFTSIKL